MITEAWMRLQGRPRFRAGAVFGFADLFAAARAVRAAGQAGLYPANLRVIDNDEAGTYGVNDYEETLLIVAFESADHPVEAWMARAVELIRDHGGRQHADESAALRWRTAFIRMPYARELTVPLGVINDTFESAVTWDRFEAFHNAVRTATEQAIVEATGRAGTVSTRFTHVYPDGVAPYYTFNARGTPGRLIEQWRHIKTRASDALLAAGGTITHHHAVGRNHMPWYRAQRPPLFARALDAAKGALDPARISRTLASCCREARPIQDQGEDHVLAALCRPSRARPLCPGPGKEPGQLRAAHPAGFLQRAADVYPERVAVIHGSLRRTYAELRLRCRRLASALEKIGIRPGDTVATMLPNIPAMVEVHFGVPMAGAVLNTLNTRLDAATIAFILEHGEAKALITDTEMAGVVRDALARLGRDLHVIDVADPEGAGGERLGTLDYEAMLAGGDPDFVPIYPADEWQAITLNYTSGTTGNPKGVVYHHRGA